MTTIRLGGRGRQDVLIATGPKKATVTASGGAQVRLLDAAEEGAASDRTHNPAHLRLPRLASATTLRVEPESGGAFPSGTTVTVWVRPESDGAGDAVVIGPVPVAGLTRHDVARLEPVDGGVRVSAFKVAADEELGELAGAARAHTRLTIGTDRIAPDRARDVMLAVDVSASMGRAVADGSLHAVVAVLTGIAAVVGRSDVPAVCLLTEPPEWVLPGPSAELPDRVLARIGECGLGIGFRPPDAGWGGYLITDAAPPGSVEPSCHLVVLGPDGPGTCLPSPPQWRTAGEHLLTVPGALAALVDSLLRPLLGRPPGPSSEGSS
jgi:hypothetical protein